MPFTDDELDTIEAAAYLCDGEPFSYFEQNVLPGLATLPTGQLWAMSGMFLDRNMPETARLIAAYARASEQAESDGSPPPDPRLFLRQWDAEELQLRIEALSEPLPF